MFEARALGRTVAVVAGLGLLLALPIEAQTWATLRSARQVQNREPLDVNLQFGVGRLTIAPADQPLLYELDLRYDEEHFTPVTDFDSKARTLRLGVKGSKQHRGGFDMRAGSHAKLGLTREVPLDLELEFGAGEAEIELGGIAIRRLRVATGASDTKIRFGTPNPLRAERVSIEAGAAELRVEGLGNARAERIQFQGGVGATTLDFSGGWTADATASVQMGIGSVVLRFPRHLAVRLNRSSFLTSFDPEGLTRQGNSYYSANWGTAEHQLTVDVSAALGSIQIEWTGNR